MPGPFGSGSFGTGLFSTSPLFTTKDIIDSVLRDTGHANPSTETNKRLAVLGFINNRYARVTQSKHWDWLYQTNDFILNEPYTTGVISLTKSSETVVGVGTNFDASMVPYHYLFPKSVDSKYTVKTVNSGTNLTIEGEAAEDLTNVGFELVQAIYELPDHCEHVRSVEVDGVGKLVPIGIQDLKRKQVVDQHLTGMPKYFSEVGRREQDGVRYIEVWPAPDKTYSAHVSFNVNIMKLDDSDTSFPLIPDRHRVVLYYGALAEMFRFLRDSEMAMSAENDFNRTYLSMLNDTQLTDSQPTIHPSRNYRIRRKGRMYRVFMDRSDFGRFD